MTMLFNAEFHSGETQGSDNHDMSQCNDQEIKDVEGGSNAENDAGNSVSFDESEDGGSNPFPVRR
jgi:hypothetical protein